MKASRRKRKEQGQKRPKKVKGHEHRCQACGRRVSHGEGDCVKLFGSIRLVTNGCNRCGDL